MEIRRLVVGLILNICAFKIISAGPSSQQTRNETANQETNHSTKTTHTEPSISTLNDPLTHRLNNYFSRQSINLPKN
jgi:hypothetical protein